jgi:hypothetical protein
LTTELSEHRVGTARQTDAESHQQRAATELICNGWFHFILLLTEKVMQPRNPAGKNKIKAKSVLSIDTKTGQS